MPHKKFGSITRDPSDIWDWQFGPSTLEKRDPTKGTTTWDALYFFIDKRLATEAYELELDGYGDETLLPFDAWLDERREFELKAFQLRHLLVDLEGKLWRKLRLGELVARGFSSQSALDAPRQEIAAERWNDLELNIRESTASGPSINITQILVFDPARETGTKSGQRKFSESALRSWYKKRVEALVTEGKRSSRGEDCAAANAEFKGGIPQRSIEALRKELAPAHWKKGGRPRGS